MRTDFEARLDCPVSLNNLGTIARWYLKRKEKEKKVVIG